jgi:hypothetical protein
MSECGQHLSYASLPLKNDQENVLRIVSGHPTVSGIRRRPLEVVWREIGQQAPGRSLGSFGGVPAILHQA